MRLFEAILDANHRAVAGDAGAGLHPSEYPDALPVVALTCIDPRLNHLLPEVLGVREEDFIWLRNAGNIIYDPLSSMMRTLSLACAIKGGKEIAVIGHSDCRVRQVSVNQLIESFRALGINRASLPDNLIEFFGLFASERQNVINGVGHIRQSPLISPKMPVHGLLLDIESGRIEWLVNGYEQLGAPAVASPLLQKLHKAEDLIGALASIGSGEIKVPDVQIGDFTLHPQKWLEQVERFSQQSKTALAAPGPHPKPASPAAPPVMEKKAPSASAVPSAIRLFKTFVGPKK